MYFLIVFNLVIAPLAISRASLLHMGTIDLRGWGSLCGGGSPVHGRTLSNVSGLHPLDASSAPPSVTTQNGPRHCQISLEGDRERAAKSLQDKTNALGHY